MANDLSSRHLPDLSNASFSFEIPAESTDELLLNNDDDEFLRATNDILPTPAPNRTVPHTHQLTLKPTAGSQQSSSRTSKLSSVKATPLSPSFQSNTLRMDVDELVVQKKGSNGMALRNEVISTPRRMQILRDEIKSLGESKYTSMSTETASSDSVEKGELRSRAVRNGGKTDIPSSKLSHPQLILPTEYTSGDRSTKEPVENDKPDVSTGGGLAERLMMYGQDLLSSQEFPNLPDNVNGVGSALTDSSLFRENFSYRHVDDESPSSLVGASNSPLTLSHLSPSKNNFSSFSTSNPSISYDAPVSPMRPSHKRQGSPVLNHQSNKKEKITADSSTRRAMLPGNRVFTKKRTASVNSSSTLVKPKLNGVRHVSGPSRLRRDPAASQSSTARSTMGTTKRVKTAGLLSSDSSSTVSESSKAALERSGDSKKASSSNLTRPKEFTFMSEKRVEARRNDSNTEEDVVSRPKKKLHSAYTIPDFKASHAAQDALLTSIRKQVNPVVPLPVALHTEARAKQRGRFNETLREKEAETERALEEKRRHQAEEEEKEMKELRKKAILKAHPVPEWYKDAPRRREHDSQSASRGHDR